MRIDIHPHVISPDTDRYPLAPVDGKRSVWSADAKSLTPEQLIAAMDVAGIDRAAVVHSSTTYGFDNSLVADAAASFPDRLTGVCSIDALAPDAVDTLKGWLDRGCTGLRLFTTGTINWNQAQWLKDPATWPVWEFASGINLPICLQVRTEGLGMVKALMDRFPAVPVILDHLAHPDLTPGPPYEDAQKAFDLASYEQLYVKFTPVILRRAREGNASWETFLPLLFETFGAKRIAWGSNFPASPGTLADLAKQTEDALSFLSEEEIERVMGGTAVTLYPSLSA